METVNYNDIEELVSQYRIRKLTEDECGFLMGQSPEAIDAMHAINCSKTSMYKAFGNSIIVNCVELLAEHLYQAQYDDSFICKDEKEFNIDVSNVELGDETELDFYDDDYEI